MGCAMATTIGVIVMNLRACCPEVQNGRCDTIADGSLDYLEAMLSLLPSDHQTFVLCSNGSWAPPYAVEGARQMRVEIVEGQVNLDRLREHVDYTNNVVGLDEAHSCTMLELLLSAPCFQVPLANGV